MGDIMKYIGMVLCVMVLVSCTTVQYNAIYTIDEDCPIRVEDVNIVNQNKIRLTITNISNEQTTLLLSESVIVHGSNTGDGLFTYTDRDSIAIGPLNVVLQSNQQYNDDFYPRSYAKLEGYHYGKPVFYHRPMGASVTLKLYYRNKEKKDAIVVNFTEITSE
jgi:hypothetical protein